MKARTPEGSGGDVEPAAPHPVLKGYYGSESERRPFVTALFDGAARYYDQVCGVGSLGSGQFYRRWVLGRSGLRQGMRLLDVATGTGLVARAATRILGDPRAVVGLDPSRGMLAEARKALPAPLVQGTMEALPFGGERFDFVSMGYALRHAADLRVVLREFLRVLKPGGRLVILEMTRPRWAWARWLIRGYIQTVLPLVMRMTTGSGHAELLMRYYWATIAECVPPEAILDVLRSTGFTGVERRVLVGLLSEYVGVKPVR